PSARNARLPGSATTAATRPGGAPRCAAGGAPGCAATTRTTAWPDPAARAGPAAAGPDMSTSSRRPAGSQAASWALATARWNRQYAVSEPGRSTASGLAVDVATLDSIRRPTYRRGQPTAPGSAARTRISAPRWHHGGHRDSRIPGEPLWLILPSLRATSPGWPSCPPRMWCRLVSPRTVMADSPPRVSPAKDLTWLAELSGPNVVPAGFAAGPSWLILR